MLTFHFTERKSPRAHYLKFCNCCCAYNKEEHVTSYDGLIDICLDCLVDRKMNVVNDIAALYADGNEPVPYNAINKFIHEQIEKLSNA